MIKKCIGCGATLQSVNNMEEGYIDSKVYDKALYCERCFKIIHYGEASVIDKRVQVLDFINNIDINIPVIYLLDLTTLSNNTLEPLRYIKNKIYLVLTKRDLIPKSIKDKKLINYVKEELDFIDDVLVISSEKMWNVEQIYNKLIRDKVSFCYVIGHTNSGKSSLINSLLKSNGEEAFITTSYVPNTTTELINIKLTSDLTIIDTPGFVNELSISNFVELNKYKKLLPKKEIKPKIYSIRPNFMILIDNIIRIENNSLSDLNLIFYFNNDLIYNKMKIQTRDDLKMLDKVDLEVEQDEDIVIEGLGFIKVLKRANLTIYTLSKDIISKRKKLI